MSRIGKKPIAIPSGVKVRHDKAARTVAVEGPKGKLSFKYRPEVGVALAENDTQIVCSIDPKDMEFRDIRAYWGTTRAQIQNMMVGASQGYAKVLEVIGVGWTVKAQGRNVVLTVGYCDPVTVPIPEGVTVGVEANRITISGPSKQAVGELASVIRSKRKPEPYKGKGIKYIDEVISRKQGKAFASA